MTWSQSCCFFPAGIDYGWFSDSIRGKVELREPNAARTCREIARDLLVHGLAIICVLFVGLFGSLLLSEVSC